MYTHHWVHYYGYPVACPVGRMQRHSNTASSASPAPAPTLLPPATTEKQIVTIWFNAGLGNALKAMELNIEEPPTGPVDGE
ncbi:MAG: hypothetical protein HYR94_09175 [Chloroflexi bacterium]|nr:hypothetical protein [Chloroflexota bacterium]